MEVNSSLWPKYRCKLKKWSRKFIFAKYAILLTKKRIWQIGARNGVKSIKAVI